MDASIASVSPVRIRETDMSGHLGVIGILQRVQDISEDFIKSIDCSCKALIERYGWSWMLALLHCEMNTLPKGEDILKTKIWPHKKLGAMLPWYYAFIDEEENVLGNVSGCWMVADLGERKMIRPKDLPFVIPADDENGAPCPLPPIMNPLKEYKIAGTKTVSCNDCDINGHMNNISYARMVLEFTDAKRHSQLIQSFDMFFAKEAKLGDELKIGISQAGDEDKMILINSADEQIFLARFKWR